MVRYFNTAGPCLPELHYMLPPEPRLPEARALVERGPILRGARAAADRQDHHAAGAGPAA